MTAFQGNFFFNSFKLPDHWKKGGSVHASNNIFFYLIIYSSFIRMENELVRFLLNSRFSSKIHIYMHLSFRLLGI